MEFSLLWAALTAAAAAWLGLRIRDEHLPDRPMDHLITAVVIGLVTGRLVAMIGDGVSPLTHPADIVIVRGGVETVAASVAFIAALVWGARKTPGAVDAMAPAVLLGLAGWHAGCVWRDTCLGTPSSLPWAWAQTGSLVTRHPVELYAAVGLVVGAIVVSRVGWRPWARAAVALGVAAGIRLITEPLRPSLSGGPVLWYAAGILIGAVAAIVGPRFAGPSGHDST
ncbi:MAG: prolipoprotein diacylglyceryl transferase family protein [Acidimicrobiia bacterium]